jgi:hypothetical protein
MIYGFLKEECRFIQELADGDVQDGDTTGTDESSGLEAGAEAIEAVPETVAVPASSGNGKAVEFW